MRPTNSAATQYSPADPPSDMAQLPIYLRQEFAKMKAALDIVADGFAGVVYVEPDKPRAGMERNADGEQWNPGQGAGKYRFDGATWVKVDAHILQAIYTLLADGSRTANGDNKAHGFKLI